MQSTARVIFTDNEGDAVGVLLLDAGQYTWEMGLLGTLGYEAARQIERLIGDQVLFEVEATEEVEVRI